MGYEAGGASPYLVAAMVNLLIQIKQIMHRDSRASWLDISDCRQWHDVVGTLNAALSCLLLSLYSRFIYRRVLIEMPPASQKIAMPGNCIASV